MQSDGVESMTLGAAGDELPDRTRKLTGRGLRFAPSASGTSLGESMTGSGPIADKKKAGKLSRSISTLQERARGKQNAKNDSKQKTDGESRPWLGLGKKKKKSDVMNFDEAAEAILNGEMGEDPVDEDDFGDIGAKVVSEDVDSSDEECSARWNRQAELERSHPPSVEVRQFAARGSFVVPPSPVEEDASHDFEDVRQTNESAMSHPSLMSPLSPVDATATPTKTKSRIFKPFNNQASLSSFQPEGEQLSPTGSNVSHL